MRRTTTIKTTTIAVLAPCLLACALLAGCATADFTPYSGAQQNWPVATGGFMDTKYAVPVFYGTPNRPYEVIGYLKAETDAYRNTRDQVIIYDPAAGEVRVSARSPGKFFQRTFHLEKDDLALTLQQVREFVREQTKT